MDKVLVDKDRIKKIAEFINLGDDCYGCPLFGKDHLYTSDNGCKENIIAYLLGEYPTGYKKESVYQQSATKVEPMNCKSCWYYQEHNGKVSCNPYANDGQCLQNLFDR